MQKVLWWAIGGLAVISLAGIILSGRLDNRSRAGTNDKMIINNGGATTTNPQVTLRLSSSGKVMKVANALFALDTSKEVAYKSAYKWKLSPGLSEKTVFVQFKDRLQADGSFDWSVPQSAKITLVSSQNDNPPDDLESLVTFDESEKDLDRADLFLSNDLKFKPVVIPED